MLFRMLFDRKLAQASYVIGCQKTGDSIVIDPERDIQRYLDLAEQEGLKITAIGETHIHADYLSGARELAEATNAKLYVSDEGDQDWKYQWLNKKQNGGSYNYQLLKDGSVFKVGNIQFTTVHTPGHTPEHICFLVTDLGGGANEPMGVLTGDFIFVGDVGRPDLLETAAGLIGSKDVSAKSLYQSLKKLQAMPDYLQIWPAHGAGSACGKALGAVPQTTVGYEKRFSRPIKLASDEKSFVSEILSGQPEPPMYFARMKKENKEGPAVLNKLPEPKKMSVPEIANIPANSVVLDPRDWQDFCQGHLANAIFAPLTNAFPTIAGSYVLAQQNIYLLLSAPEVDEAVVDLVRIGLDRIQGYFTPSDFAEYRKQGGKVVALQTVPIQQLKQYIGTANSQVLDVRGASEYEADHVPQAYNIAHTRLLARINEVPTNKKLLVHCRSGVRASYASAFLQSRGYDVIHFAGMYDNWK